MRKTCSTFIVILILMFVVNCAFGDRIIYVDDDAAGGDGKSWAMAYKYLQDGLIDANSLLSVGEKVEIRIAQGMYKPHQYSDRPPIGLSGFAA